MDAPKLLWLRGLCWLGVFLVWLVPFAGIAGMLIFGQQAVTSIIAAVGDVFGGMQSQSTSFADSRLLIAGAAVMQIVTVVVYALLATAVFAMAIACIDLRNMYALKNTGSVSAEANVPMRTSAPVNTPAESPQRRVSDVLSEGELDAIRSKYRSR
jgi:hypothetical protein